MASSSPTLAGFRAILRQPSLGLAEIAWRWSFGLAAILLVVVAWFEYLNTLIVTRGDLLLLRSRQPVLISHALGNIVRGSGARLVDACIVLAIALIVGWIIVASLARAATLKALFSDVGGEGGSSSSSSLPALLGLNFLRAAAALAALLAAFAALPLLDLASTPDEAGMVFQIAMIVSILVWFAWSMVNWLLSRAVIFVGANRQDTFGAIFDAADFFLRHSGPVFSVGAAFGLAHTAAFLVACTLAAVPLGMASVLRGRVVLAGLAVIFLIYSAVVDFLYVGRLAAYAAIVQAPEAPPSPLPTSPAVQPGSGIDRSELILSDVPAI